MNLQSIKVLLFCLGFMACQSEKATAPDPVLPIPTAAQLDWQNLELYAFVHFNMNTFTNQEWGFGDESPELFAPTNLDCNQWAKVAKEAGMKGIILTAKHHDGFCLWPSKYTEHSVKNAPWKDGKGDVVRDLAKACKQYDLKLGIYYSPWDRNHADYGTPEYLIYMRNQLKELLTDYGDVFEVWFDGANGGTGYYGGANEERFVDKKTYYEMQKTYDIIRELQPNAVIFSDAGPDVRWVGNEEGYAFETMWSNLLRDSVYAGMPEYSKKYASGQEFGTHWVPGETNVSIRPGWYYHEYEDHKVRSLPALVDMYYNSIGRNTNFLLNFPVDKSGQIHEADIAQLEKLTATIKADFETELAKGSRVKTSNDRGFGYKGKNVLDNDNETYWAAEDDVTQAQLTIKFKKPTTFNQLVIQEYIALGQRIKEFEIAVPAGNEWEIIASGTTVGNKRILRFPTVTEEAVMINITASKACPTISNIEVYHAPKLLVPPVITRNRVGEVTIDIPTETTVYYTIDGSEPTINAEKYKAPFVQLTPATIKAIAVDEKRYSEVSQVSFDVAAAKWQVMNSSDKATSAIDGDDKTWFESPTNEVIIDLGKTLTVRGFTYLPMQQRWISGFIKEYAFYTSLDSKKWTLAKKGEFSNIMNSPINQRITFDAQQARYIKLKSLATIDKNLAGFAEITVLTE